MSPLLKSILIGWLGFLVEAIIIIIIQCLAYYGPEWLKAFNVTIDKTDTTVINFILLLFFVVATSYNVMTTLMLIHELSDE